ncbi:MAG: glycerophosphodiester phosphodiesterase [Spirochaetales bacterium]|nr:glycerophosphodiester phosphodiesterase [Spirochaetales bacterium]
MENTLAAFEHAREIGIDGVELDVQVSADGVVVVAHDSDLLRLGDDPRSIAATAARDLAAVALHARSASGVRLSASGVPDLDTVLDCLGGEMLVDIEIKSYPETPPEIAARVAEVVVRRGVQHRVLISSFDPRHVMRFRRIARRRGLVVPTAVIWSEDREVPVFLRSGFGCRMTGSDLDKPHWASYVKRRYAQGTPRLAWTVNERETALALARRGIAALIGDDPEALRTWTTGAAGPSGGPYGDPRTETPL